MEKATVTVNGSMTYQLSSITAANGSTTIQTLNYGYDAAGNITAIVDLLDNSRTQNLSYDNLNRLQTAAGAYGSQSYGYDAVGNRTSRVVGSTTETYAISPTSNQINTITVGSNVRSFTYLPTGQVQNDTRDPPHAYVYTYNQTGRLASAALNCTTVAAYLVNGLEQRVVKTVGSTTTHFIFDRLGHLLAEADGATGAALREYIWLDDLPVAMVDDTGPSPVIYYIHTDNLGTPQKLTDSAMNIVWDGQFDPFGNASSIGGSATMNLRFPGQYFDAETGIAQNWNRDYDPTLGRYIESDPLGLLASGVNTYEYVGGNPLRGPDPSGLSWWDWQGWPWNWGKKPLPPKQPNTCPPQRLQNCTNAFVQCLLAAGGDSQKHQKCAEVLKTCIEHPERGVIFPPGGWRQYVPPTR